MPYSGSTTILGNAETFTGFQRPSGNYDTITGTVFASSAGTLNVEQSSDGVNWDKNDSTAVSASTGTSFNVTIVAPYWRLRYVNSATPQTVFRLHARAQAAGKN